MQVNTNHEVSPLLQHGSLAAARVNDCATPAELQAAATALGFQTTGPNKYQHPDGSWVELTGELLSRGYLKDRFSVRPDDVRFLPASTAAADGVAATLKGLRAHDPGLQASLVACGLAAILPNFYSHPDGSWVAVIGDAVMRGVGQQRIADTPAKLAEFRQFAELPCIGETNSGLWPCRLYQTPAVHTSASTG